MASVERVVVVVDAEGQRNGALDFKLEHFAVLDDGTRISDGNWSGGTSFAGGGFFVIGENADSGPPALKRVVKETVETSVREDADSFGAGSFETLAQATTEAGVATTAEGLGRLPLDVEFTGHAERLIDSLASASDEAGN